ncbi:tetratricopeptide repeat protein [Lentzea sp. DG1S-22]|uniref:ATP-binding protein n=1 Tax=Lentzea sp. DG1S-22 TaxID=3108822 RepID=UPI002E78C91B|nr:tetratricopeptide repeat protein [Lentzea sp. DG1S-22]WVH82295.1 tetratricopeptide repeat protein [Lentzea sp. DG1S-22]
MADLPGLIRELDLLRCRAATGTSKARVSIARLAEMAGLPRSTVHTYVTGRAFPAADVLDQLVIALGATPAELSAWGDAWFRVAAATGGPRPRTTVPRQLPAVVDPFVGRHVEAALMDEVLRSAAGSPILAVTGTAGVGKTALAVRWAHQVADRFPAGQLYVDLRGYDPADPARPEEVLGRFLRELGVAVEDLPAGYGERSARLRTELADRRVLLVLDNAHSAEQVRDLLPGTPGCAVVVTSRDALTGLVARDGAHRVPLELLPTPAAAELLRTLIGRRAQDDLHAVDELAECCAHLPLALRIAAEYVRAHEGTSLPEVIHELRDEHRRLAVLNAGGDVRAEVEAVFSWSYRHLGRAEAELFGLLSVHPGAEFTAESAAALADLQPDVAAKLIAQLVQAHLVSAIGADRFAMHDLLRAYAATVRTARVDDALQRLLTFYGHAATTAMDTLYPADRDRRPRLPAPATAPLALTEPGAAQSWLDAERATLIAVVALTERRGWTDWTAHFAATLWRDLDAGGHGAEALTVHHHALAAAEARGDRDAEATALRNLATALRGTGNYRDSLSYTRRCAELRRELGDEPGEAAALNTMAIVQGLLGHFDDAIACYHRALTIRRRTGEHRSEGAVLLNLAATSMRAGRLDDVPEHLDRALALFRLVADEVGEAHAHNNLGTYHRHVGDPERALAHHSCALAGYRACGNVEGEVNALNGLGRDHASAGNPAKAFELHEQALAAARDGHHVTVVDIHNSIGEALRALDRHPEARPHHSAARELATESGDQFERARALAGLAECNYTDGDLDTARELWFEALGVFTHLGVPQAADVRARLDRAVT